MTEQLNYIDSDMQHYSKLVLSIEEYIKNNKGYISSNLDMRVFIYYDKNQFVIYGKRQDSSKNMKKGVYKYVPFYITCKTKNDTIRFMKFITGSKSLVSIGLYNYNNILTMEDPYYEINYEFFEENQDKYYELIAFDNESLYDKDNSLEQGLDVLMSTNTEEEVYICENEFFKENMSESTNLTPDDEEQYVGKYIQQPSQRSKYYSKSHRRREQRRRAREKKNTNNSNSSSSNEEGNNSLESYIRDWM